MPISKKTGGRVLAIAHNGNLSNGLMFPTVEAFGKQLDAEYVTTRAKWEPLYETTQPKGTGEAHPILSPDDEFADFELWDKGNLDGSVPRPGYAAVRIHTIGSAKADYCWKRNSAPTRSRWAWLAAAMPTRAWRRWKRTISSARPHHRSPARNA